VSPKRAKPSGWPFADGRHTSGGPDAASVGRLETLAHLVEDAADLLAADSSTAVVVEIAERLADALGFDAARVCLWDAGAARLLPLEADPGGAPVLAAGFTVGDLPHASLAIYDQSPAFLRAGDVDVTTTEQAELNDRGHRCLLTLPLVHEGGIVGVVELAAARELEEPGVAESVLAKGICRRLAAAVHHGDSFDSLRTRAAGATADVRELAERLDVTAVLTELAHHLAAEIGVTRCDILVRKADPNAFGVVARYSAVADPERSGGEMHVTLGDWGARAQAVAMQCTVTSYRDGGDLEPVQMAEMALLHQRATMTVPIINDGEVAGLVNLIETRRDRRFTAAEIAVVEGAARSVSPTIARARQQEELKSQNEELRLLLEIGAAISSSMEPSVILSTITERLVTTLGVAWSNIYDYDADKQEVEVIAYYQVPEIAYDPDWLGSRFDRTHWPDGHRAAETRQPQTKYYDYASLSPDDLEQMREWGEKATLSVPLVFQDEVVGLIDVAESRYPRTFTDAEIRLVTAIAAQAAAAIYHARLFTESRRRNEELAAMLGAAQTLTSAGDLEAVLRTLAQHLRAALGTQTAEVYDYDESTHSCRLEGFDVAEGVDTSSWAAESPPVAVPYFRECIETRRPASAFHSDPELPDASRAELEKWGDTAVLCVPMVYGEELLGVAYLADPEERRFSEQEIGLAVGIAAQGAAAINNARAFAREQAERERLARFNERLRKLVELSGRIRGIMEDGELLELLGEVMSEAFGFTCWAAYLCDADGGTLRRAARVGFAGDDAATWRVVVFEELQAGAERISGSFWVDHRRHTWTRGEKALLPDGDKEPRAEGQWQVGDALFVPMVGQSGQLIGYIQAGDAVDHRLPSETTVQLLEVFAAKAASSVEVNRLNDRLEEQVRTDGLTGLYNHRFLDERLDAEVTRARRTSTPLSVLMVDFDDFKRFNDTYGHPQGDKLLKRVAELLLKSVRNKVDLVARFGGDEFVVLLPGIAAGVVAGGGASSSPGAHGRSAADVAESIRAAAAVVAHEGYPGRLDVHVTLSIGVASLPEHGETGTELMMCADKALYVAKRAGMNQICVFTA